MAGETAIVCIWRWTADRQGSGIPAESEPKNTTRLPQQRNPALHAGGRQNPIPNFRHRTYPDEWVQGSIQMQRKRMIFLEGAQFAVCLFHPVFKKRPFPIKIWKAYRVGPYISDLSICFSFSHFYRLFRQSLVSAAVSVHCTDVK